MGNAGSGMQLPWLRGDQKVQEKEVVTEGSLLAMGAYSVVTSGFGDLEKAPRGGAGYQRPQGFVPGDGKTTLKIMSYNVCSNEEVHVNERMKAIGELIEHHSPDIVLLQDVTKHIYEIFMSFSWWDLYKCSVSPEKASRKTEQFCIILSKFPVRGFISKQFSDTEMGRSWCSADIDTGLDKKLIITTCQLESCTAENNNSSKRLAQVEELQALSKYAPNVIWGGAFNWDEDKDKAFPLNDGLMDAWETLKPAENGGNYDTETNSMRKNQNHLQKRFDRFIYRLEDFSCKSVELIGTEAINGVLPSDHYGLILIISFE
ncbi:5'-tyrosyl-DNA phosphodiesterase-like [Dioscorea cayenensis subsp. rotundata]|uniref:5'-tyrosyl-DNA phosphodiesterase-like n=1 Tax=Dioscorea cayennensis subsp. rotundata TaxID=55577 RepID=A0AB40ATI5_DIOCR|nr:5'-tyrosyl-DNA phosphodiesterase-like [Dioscorea cayenensis subsp. rotundata]XP_039118295.1 5'-tyrosyl-DNA phosphodiesterase-like [Dioscorea cayenensis subsp. rotundata]XP_039118296.1 5'-tyrosyl-DNA phosphodiesterase-like [Dioscorea cayenensis subsp. rotundata]XP_039118297.1 5'-tyrosyl-DNA phosphodiesterase-like [Dioscorea cayenensis subsp. rotundata]